MRQMIRMCFGDPQRVPRERIEQAFEEMRERAEQPWADRALTRSMRGLITSYLRVGRTNAWRAARALRPPTLVLWGSRDRLVDPALAPRLAAAVPDSRLLILDGVGHVAMLEVPEPTARAVLGMVEELMHAGRGQDDAVPEAALPGGPDDRQCSGASLRSRATERETLTR